MELQERLQYCKICQNRKMDASIGLVCGLTDAKPAFEDKCPDFKPDEEEANRLMERDRAIQEEGSDHAFAPESAGIKKGVVGGIVMIVIAVVWFVGGLAAGYVFFYPPILLLIGVYALVRGLIKRNYSGERK